MYAVTSTPLDKRTRATLRRAEFGFFGVVVYTRVQTPRRWGEPFRAGVLVLLNFELRPWRTSCWMVGTRRTSSFDELSGCARTHLCRGPCNVMLATRGRQPGVAAVVQAIAGWLAAPG